MFEVDFGLRRPGGSPILGSMLGARLYEQSGRGKCAQKEEIARGSRERVEMHKM